MTRPRPKDSTAFVGGRVVLRAGDCLDVLDGFAPDSFDACVTDPPYHLHSIVKRFARTGRTGSTRSKSGPHQRTATGFMGARWDGGDVAFRPETWAKVLRVLKPGAYIVAFSSSRTFGRMSVAIEDAGFITHPLFGWIFGQGFPKAHRVDAPGHEGFRYGGQACKPALEPVYIGQKPFSEATGTANVLRWGTGAINVEGCRIAADGGRPNRELRRDAALDVSRNTYGRGLSGSRAAGETTQGRWPSNLIHDGSEEVIAAFPDAPGQQADASRNPSRRKSQNVYGTMAAGRPGEASALRRYGDKGSTNFAVLPGERRGDTGSAARFFYAAKADAADRCGSKHPTIKPLDLIQYLVRMHCPPGGCVLDPFAGTGTTGEAAFREGMRAVLIEREPEYQDDIARRMDLALAGPDERRRKLIEAAGKVEAAGPLFDAPQVQAAE